jgi:hypothetical protein
VRNGLFPMAPAGSKLRTVMERDYDKTALLPTIELTDSIWDVKRSGRQDWYVPFMSMSNAWYRGTYREFEPEKKRNRNNFKESLPIDFIEGEHYPRYYFADQIVTIRNRQDFATNLSHNTYTSKVAFVQHYPSFVPARGEVRSVSETANTAMLDVVSNAARHERDAAQILANLRRRETCAAHRDEHRLSEHRHHAGPSYGDDAISQRARAHRTRHHAHDADAAVADDRVRAARLSACADRAGV